MNMENADDTDQGRQPRKTAVAAVSKMKLIDASEEEEDTSEHKARSRTNKRAAVIQSSSESEGHDQQGKSHKIIFKFTLMDSAIEWSMAKLIVTWM